MRRGAIAQATAVTTVVIQMAIATPMSSLARLGQNASRWGKGGWGRVLDLNSVVSRQEGSLLSLGEEKGAQISGGMLLSYRKS